MNMFNQAQWWKKYLSKEYLSLNIIKHTCSWHNKFYCSTTKLLGKIRRSDCKQFLYFLLYVNSLKRFFVSKTKLYCFKKKSIFSYSLLPIILKLIRSRSVFLVKILYNQFLLLKNYRLWHWLRSFIWFIPTNLDPLYLISPQSDKFLIGVESVKIL